MDADPVQDDMLQELAINILRLVDDHKAAMARLTRTRRDAALAREMMAMEDSDPAADRADWKFHQDHDQ